jgi:hypothetical protein
MLARGSAAPVELPRSGIVVGVISLTDTPSGGKSLLTTTPYIDEMVGSSRRSTVYIAGRWCSSGSTVAVAFAAACEIEGAPLDDGCRLRARDFLRASSRLSASDSPCIGAAPLSTLGID